jgi:proline iminopeptidase
VANIVPFSANLKVPMSCIETSNTNALPQSGTLRRGQFELGYSVEGSGQPALVIGSSVYYSRTFSVHLREKLQLVFLDHRGFAPAVEPFAQADYELGVILDDIEAMRQHLSLGKVVVVGHSGHGYMALEYAKKYPQHVSYVVLIATGPSQSESFAQLTERHFQEAVCLERKARLEEDLRLLGNEIAAAPDRRFITFCIRLGARSWFDPNFDGAPLWEGVHVNMPIFDYLWGEVFASLDITQDLELLEAPVFLALGRFDYLVAPHFAWEPYREAFRDLTIRVFDRSSHTPQLEESSLFDQELLLWLNEKN